MKRLLIIAALAALVVAYFFFGLGDYLTVEGIKQVAGDVGAYYERNPAQVIAGFFLVYVAVAAASLPGAAVMTLAAGALFGVLVGTIIVSFASTLGATLAFLASRYVLRDGIEARFGERLRTVNQGLERDGAFYLFTIRMIPLFPFFVVNLVMGLTRIGTWTFAWVSQVGMLLGTIVYVNAGTQLARIDSLSGIASPAVLASFALLGIAPWFAKAIIGWIKRRKVYAGFNRPKSFDRNLVVIGAGSAGLVSALIAATVKAKVTLVEANKMGGDCLNTGCVPSKALIKSAKVAEQMRHADRYGITPTEPDIPFGQTIERVMQAIRTIEPHDSVERYTGLGVDVVEGYGKVVDPWTVEIARKDGVTQRLTTRSIVIAAGAEPFVPAIPGLEQGNYLTSETMWDAFAKMERAPARIAVLGGGPIGCELSQALARLGSRVTQVEMAERVLGREDDEVSALAQASLEASGVEVLTGHRAARVEPGRLIADRDDSEVAIEFDVLIVAVGRAARLTGYGLEDIGIDTTKTVVTDDFLATRFPNIYAAGDVAGPYQFTHTASHQAWFASVNALFGQFKRFKADYRVIPAVTFLDPEIARVGLNEREAREQGVEYEVTRYELDGLDRAIADSERQGFVKVLTPPGKDTILGATIVGAHAGELLAEYVLAMKHKLGLNKILGTIHSYPTMAEANKFAAGEWKKKHKPEALLALVEKYHAWRRR
ncbi:FAD-dependent oxidoreductase [Qipengyuania flava]|uniref:FAD-dependent oxidoreductase n=1 Tax=Qipengyuania flava TaxID=192812 RepID=UPI001C5820B7|nr:bifunctional TVP38/TMEM64 family protein/FAD-dependent oxidoreductase [Qipengyuania flava]MBW3167355.1 FAD-dependent oxidoreductase [Qipengyuania flava]MBY5964593.1 FAD-dependent oxidoreductase [Qipengyuania flava]MBY6010917.1 FAD-dependent oxidoreductase [Qipengyuania flava]MBY6025359.1 FAD-dependent oxidoreductase [Qipengyuania flava]